MQASDFAKLAGELLIVLSHILRWLEGRGS